MEELRRKRLERLMEESKARSDKLRKKWLDELHTAEILKEQMKDLVAA
jgi:hypothetical protein